MLLNHHILEEMAVAEGGESALPDLINQSHPSRTALTQHHVSLYIQKINSTSMMTYAPLLADL